MLFIHSSFRVSSTWLWTRFRAVDRAVAYYEVFNEQLATLTPAQVMAARPDGWLSHHPPAEPYFLEYLPLLQEKGGVSGFKEEMAFARFVPLGGIDGTLGDDAARYLQGLIDHAEHRGKTPVLTCCRSLGRFAAIKRALPGLHILLYRNLFEQWCSYVDQAAHDNSYFMDTIRRTLKGSQSDAVLSALMRLFPLEKPGSFNSLNFYCFVLMHLYLYAHAFAAADLIIDVNRLALDKNYRQRTEGLITLGSGLLVDLAGARNSITHAFRKAVAAETLVEQFDPLIKLFLTDVPTRRAHEFAIQIFADFVEEYRRYEPAFDSAELDGRVRSGGRGMRHAGAAGRLAP